MSTEQPFVHLHVHTEFSLLDGLCKIDKLVERAKSLGMHSLAITDHGAMHGVINFFRAAQRVGIKPIIGMEGYLARRDMRIKDPTEKSPFHLLLLARNETGYKNLLKIASVAQLEGFYNRPRIDKDFLAAHADGLICTSGCLAAEIPRLIEDGREDEARQAVGWYQDVFGKGNFFLELQYHDIPQLMTLNRWLVDHRNYANVPLLATNDVHYIRQEDYDTHDTLLCIQTSTLKTDQKRLRMTDPSYHLRSPHEMWDLFVEVPEALRNTLLVAEMCDVNLETKGYHLPVFPVPEGHTAQSYLHHLAQAGLRWRYGSQAESPELQERLNYELHVIHDMGFDTYFLIVWDLCQFARHADIWWNVRGSGAGSVTAYSLGITNIDPIGNQLIFERFLNPGRKSMPDIDIDFPDDRRMEMIGYAMRKYGSDKVAAIITFGTLKARAAIKDVGRVLDYPLPTVNNLTRLVPQIPSRPVTLAQCLSDDEEKAVPALKEMYNADPSIQRLLDVAITVEGMSRNAGTHAAGVIIADRPLVEYIPLHRPIGDTSVSQVTQFPMEVCESIGLLKVDFLGLSTLTIMRKACELIERYHGIRFTMDNIPFQPDPKDRELTARVKKLFDLIGQGETTGVFQLESSGMKDMLKKMKPRAFEHIIAAISLYRPGPMELIPTYIRRMHGQEKVTYHHPLLAPILKETYGIIVYQEQIQQIAAQLFGYSLGDADLMRRAVSKKKPKDLAEHKQKFMDQGPKHGVSAEVAEKIFGEIEYFASYGFNKSHAADYAVLTCQTAYLKAHFPAEYYIALLSVQRDNIADVALFMRDCRSPSFGIPILPPSVNASDLDFTIEQAKVKRKTRPGIRYGLGAVKNAGEKAVEQIIGARQAGGPFKDVSDFCRRVDLRQVGKRALESLVKVGAFDDLGDRDVLLHTIDRMLKFSADDHHAREIGQISMFGEMSASGEDSVVLANVSPDERSSQRERLRWEKDLVGIYVSPHPLYELADQIQLLPNVQYAETLRRDPDEMNGRGVTVVGLVVGIRPITTRKGDLMAIISLEDVTGTIDCVFFPRTWNNYEVLIEEDALIRVSGKADNTKGEIQIIVDSVSTDLEIVQPAEGAGGLPPYAVTNGGNGSHDSSLNGDDNGDLPDETPAPPVSLEASTPPEDDGLPDWMFQAQPDEAPPDAEPEPAREPARTNGKNARRAEAESAPAPQSTPPPPALRVEPVAKAEDDEFEDEEEPGLPPCLITITVQRGEDPKKDTMRTKRVITFLKSYPGQDRFRLRLVDPNNTVTVDFPNITTCYEGPVEDFLLKTFGAEAIQVHPLPES